MVLRGFTTIWSLATLPTSRSPFSLTATTLGRMSEPLSLGTTRATLLRPDATPGVVVARSMPSRVGFSDGMELPDATARDASSARKASEPDEIPDAFAGFVRLERLGLGDLSAG